MPSTRQLAAIIFTDIVGYTALMGKDEQRAFEFLDKNRQIQKPIIEQYNGRWIKELGDGVMASFNTVSDAVNAAIKIQQACNSSKEFQLRIGIHLGELVFENDDVFGDGVNIASRIQAIANPGSIYISETVHNSISNKKEFQTKFVKEEKLKNVKEPVKIYQVVADNVVIAHQRIAQKIKQKRNFFLLAMSILIILVATYFFKGGYGIQKNDNPVISQEMLSNSIAVLPFENMPADSAQEYFSDGLTDALITELAQIPGLTVISMNTVVQLKGKTINPVEVGDQFNVRYILQTRMQRSGNKLRITPPLIETRKGQLIWANKFDKEMKDLFAIQDDISKHIMDSLKIVIDNENSILGRQPTENMNAYVYYMRGIYLFRQNSGLKRDLIDSAIVLFEKAIELDPKFALAYAALGKACIPIAFIHDPDPKWEAKAYVAIEKALSLDPKLANAYAARGDLAWTLSNGFPHEKAIKDLKRALELNPNLVTAHESLGSIYFHIGLFDKALHELRIAIALDPMSRFAKPRMARIHWYEQKLDSALEGFSPFKENAGWLREKAMVLFTLGRTAEAFKTMDEATKRIADQNEIVDLAAGYSVLLAGTSKKKEAEEQVKYAIEHGEGRSHFHHAEHLIASAYALMGNTKAAVEWLQKAADHGLPCYPLFTNDPNLKNIRNDPGYIFLMEKLKKQWEIYKSTL